MPNDRAEKTGDQMTVDQWLQIRKEEGLRIDPQTAEIFWTYAQTLDPYGVDPELPEECRCIGREYFARSPGSDICVHFDDLPDETREKLWQMHSSELAFPAGLEDFLAKITTETEMGETATEATDGGGETKR